MIFGYALHRLGSYGRPLLDMIDRFAHVMVNSSTYHETGALGAFGAMAFTIGAYGVGRWCSWVS